MTINHVGFCQICQNLKYCLTTIISYMKHLLIPENTHSKLVQYKAKQKLKTLGNAIDKLLEPTEGKA
jgi:hypothetical protein